MLLLDAAAILSTFLLLVALMVSAEELVSADGCCLFIYDGVLIH